MGLSKSKSKKLEKAKADKYFSQYIRERDTDYRGLAKCCTCGKWYDISKLECGHFISRRKEATRFDERNAHAQCKRCNRYHKGRQYEHSLYINERYGEGTAKELHIKAQQFCKRTQEDYHRIAKKYYKKLNQIS